MGGGTRRPGMDDTPFRTTEGVAVPAVTAAEMRTVDRLAEELGLGVVMMMENAGRTLARLVGERTDGEVVVYAGGGGNGGGGLACARHLTNHGHDVHVVLDRPADRMSGAAGRQLAILREMGLPIVVGADSSVRADGGSVAIDAVIGYGLESAVREPARGLVAAMNDGSETVISLDVPTGLDATTGNAPGAVVASDAILTPALPKTGLATVDGTLYLADIGIPGVVFERADLPVVTPFRGTAMCELASIDA